MEPIEPIYESPPVAATPSPAPGGIRRLTATAALALGLMLAGGTAVVLAASPEPTASDTPAVTTQPSTNGESTDDAATPDSRAGTGTALDPDCPEGGRGGRGAAPGGTAPSQGTDDSAPSTTPSTDPTTTPSVPTVDDSEV